MISFAVFTGCRVGEILGAAWSHIDWPGATSMEEGQFHVRRAFREGHSKNLRLAPLIGVSLFRLFY